jgi:LacI family repressor for deo operon, udp, cdd, tsx, nupC, and nupG
MVVTLKDVARHANVSIQTVSNVINGREAHVSVRTRILVLNAINDLKYRPNLAARHLRNAPVGVLALAIPDLNNPYFSDIATLVISVAAEHGYAVLVDHTFADRTHEAMAANGLRPHLVDGVILDPQSLLPDDLEPREDSIPTVLLGERVYGNLRDHVAIDNVAIAREATAHLIQIGRKRIGTIGMQEVSTRGAPGMRLQGYVEALKAAGVPQRMELAIPAYSWLRADGVRGMRRLLSRPDPPDAVFCFNDLMALGAMFAAREAGFQVPQDIAVVGIDDIEEARFSNPTLTTGAPDKDAIARAAVGMLIGRIDGSRTGEPELVTPPARLILRESTVGLHREPRLTPVPGDPAILAIRPDRSSVVGGMHGTGEETASHRSSNDDT